MADNVILGIHSNVRATTIDPTTGQPIAEGLTAGHGWLTVTRNGQTTSYGLWPDNHPNIQRDGLSNGDGSDIRQGREDGWDSAASRYFQLTPEQVKTLEAQLKENVTWSPTNNCSSWASETLEAVTGVKVNADEGWSLGVVETPRVLGETIHDLEQQNSTSPEAPAVPPTRTESSLSSMLSEQKEDALSPAGNQVLHDSDRLVHQLAEKNNLQWNQGMTNTVAAVAADARANGLTGITHLAVQEGEIRYAQMDGPTLRDGHVNALEAANTPAEQSMQALKENDQAALAQEKGKLAERRPAEAAHALDAPVLAGP